MSPILGARGGLSASAYGFTSAVAVGPGDYQSISTFTVGSGGSSSIDFTSIPSTYKHLQIRILIKTNSSGSRVDAMKIQYNGDTSSSNYYTHQLYGSGTAAGSQGFSGAGFYVAYIAGSASGNTDMFGVAVMDVLDYTSTQKIKNTRSLAGFDGAGLGYVVLNSGGWYATPAAITSIKISPDAGSAFTQHSSFALYGIK